MGTTKKYWTGFDELKDPDFVNSQAKNEFTEEIPVDKFLGDEKLESSSTSRRDFLKYLGFSVTAASLAACETPVYKAVPYVVKPDEITPGVANWYSSTYFDGRDYCSVIVKTREGRPIKIEGNTLSPVTKGGTSARVQASVLSLYDSARITGPYAKGAPSTWASVDKAIGAELGKVVAAGKGIRILTSTIISPSTHAVIADFMAKYPNSKHVTYDPVSHSAIRKAHGGTLPTFSFDKANVIVSIGCDFLINWVAPIEHAKQYGITRKLNKDKKEMSKHYQFESIMSTTGSNADIRIPVKPSQLGVVAVALHNAVAGASNPAAGLPADVTARIAEAAKMLTASKGKALVVAGSNDVAVQTVVNAINQAIGSYGSTIDTNASSNLFQGDDEAFASLVSEMNSGAVGALLVHNVNPVYSAPGNLKFAEAYKKVGLIVSFADRIDETAATAHYVCPDNHYLESWNDASPVKGHYSLTQPAISQLFAKPRHEGTRQMQDTLLLWAGANMDYYHYIQKHWETKIFPGSGQGSFKSFWNQSLHDGVAMAGGTTLTLAASEEKKDTKNTAKPAAEDKVAEPTSTGASMDVTAAAQAIAGVKASGWEISLYEKAGVGNGNNANNPWLQELPDPISRVTWDNYITMNPADMLEEDGETERYSLLRRGNHEGSVVTIGLGNQSITAPIYPSPGQARGTIGLALGYGRTMAGKVANNVGVNAYPFVQWNDKSKTFVYDASNVSSAASEEKHDFASVQSHHTLMDRHEVFRETTLPEYQADPRSGNPAFTLPYQGKETPIAQLNLWDNFEKPNHRWGMTIDLNSCIGCGSCVVSCHIENNVPVVGKTEVMRSRDMHWLRIDRYFSSDMSKIKAHEEGLGKIEMYTKMEDASAISPQVVFQPMLCQHCNHAPCETVCPVLATNHSNEGQNQMVYNRCVGTRYCANNCPYKVRRFNWFNYIANPDFADVNPAQDELGKMVLNPDVVVRSRGVMEKCTLCLQRTQEAKLNAKKQQRKLRDGEAVTACAQACPTNAIIFGDLNDETSVVSDSRKNERTYFALEQVGTQPSLAYLTKVRNVAAGESTFDVISKMKKSHGGHEEKHEEQHEEKHETKEKHS
jgi:molybdopterin-containing oxidoreductase family iron-sulfur binding subunit